MATNSWWNIVRANSLAIIVAVFSPSGVVQILRGTRSPYSVSTFPLISELEPVADQSWSLGFSRGAYIARRSITITIESHSHFQCRIYTSSLAGMLHAVGLLPAGNLQQVPFAYRIYKAGKNPESREFKKTFSVDVTIDFIGVWYVSALSILPQGSLGGQGHRLICWLRSQGAPARHSLYHDASIQTCFMSWWTTRQVPSQLLGLTPQSGERCHWESKATCRLQQESKPTCRCRGSLVRCMYTPILRSISLIYYIVRDVIVVRLFSS